MGVERIGAGRKRVIESSLFALLSSIGLFILFGIPTRLIPNPWFARMIPANIFDYIFLASSAVLLGAYIGVSHYKKNASAACAASTYAGGAGSFLAFACPICNKLLVLLFGATALMAYLEPYRPVLGFVSSSLLAGALYWRIRN